MDAEISWIVFLDFSHIKLGDWKLLDRMSFGGIETNSEAYWAVFLAYEVEGI